MPETIDAGRLQVPVIADLGPVTRQLGTDLRTRALAAGNRAGAAIGSGMAASANMPAVASRMVTAFTATYDRQMSRNREQMARKAISPEQFRAQAIRAAEAFNQGILSTIDRLARRGQLTGALRQKLVAEMKDVGRAAGNELGRGMEQGSQAGIARLTTAVRAFMGLWVVSKIVQWGARASRALLSTAADAERLTKSYMQVDAAAQLFGVNGRQMHEMAARVRQEFQLSATAANELVVQTTKLAARAGEAAQTEELLARALDLGAAQGYDAAQVAMALEQTLRGLDEGTDKLLQRNPSQIYADWAREAGVAVGTMTDLQQKQALMNAIMTEGAKVQGAYADFLQTSVGEQVRWRVMVQESREELGQRMIPVLNNARRMLAGPFADGVRLVSGLLERMMSPAQRLTLQLERMGQAAAEAMPALLRENIQQAERDLRSLSTRLAQARVAFGQIDAQRGGNMAGGRAGTQAARDLPGLRQQVAELSAQRARAEGEELEQLIEQIDALNRIVEIEEEIGAVRRQLRVDQASLGEAERRQLLIAQVRDIEAQIAALDAQMEREGESVALNRAMAALEVRKTALERELGIFQEEQAEETAVVEQETEAQLRAREKLMEERATMERDLADRVFALTAGATDIALRELDRLEEEFHEKFGAELPAAVQEGFAELRANITRSDVLGGLREQFDALRDSRPSAGLVQDMERLLETAEAEMNVLPENLNLREEYLELIREIADAMRDTGKATREAAEEDRRQTEDRIRVARDQARVIEENARAGLQLAEAFGMIDSEAAQALESVVQLGTSIARVFAGDLSAIPSAVGAFASLVSSIFSDDGDEEARRQMSEYMDVLAELTRTIREWQTAVVASMSLNERQTAAELLRDVYERGIDRENHRFDPVRITDREELAAIRELEELLGVDILGDDNIIETANELRALGNAMTALEEGTIALGMFPPTLEGQLDGLRFILGMLGDAAGDAGAQLERFLDTIDEYAPEFAAAIRAALEEGGPEAAQALIDQLAEAFATGGLEGVEAVFGRDLNAEEVRRLLEDSNAFLEELVRGAMEAGGITQPLAITRQITEITASRLVGELSSIRFYSQLTSEQASAIRRLLEGSIYAPAGAVAAAPGGVTVQFDALIGSITVGPGIDPTQIEQEASVAARRAVEQVTRVFVQELSAERRSIGR